MSRNGTVLQTGGQHNDWADALAMETGIRVASCYRCLRCSNSCPVSTFMDLKPHQVVRLAHLGQKEKLLASSAIWICLNCEMCTTYCPNEVDVAGLMNHLKNMVVDASRKPAEYEIAAFHEAFLDVLRNHGRMNDLQLMNRYKWKTLIHGIHPSLEEMRGDMALALELLKRKRLKLFPERSHAAHEVRSIMRQHGRKEVLA
jgi:heterodisulfide reductase subunit C